MNHENDKQLRQLLKQAVAPVEHPGLRRDLWPHMLDKLNHQPLRVPWFDWALAALLGAVLVLFPGVIPALLYHL